MAVAAPRRSRPCRPDGGGRLAAANEQGAAALIDIGLNQGERFVDAQPCAHRITIRPRRRRPCASSPAARMTAMISSTLGGSAD
jgi:hypothetical protein